ncbi:MAG: 3'-5' exonuclease [Bdellovibrionales bacterium]|nr:3'-5' exonuclease [Bdellovibrionales bacterium]NQZ19950.1 3'-5' exonuclease [Bdellovibrionales bacterium]
MQFIAFDLETTGTVAGVDQIVEIGAVKYDQGQPIATYSTLVDPKRSMPAGATAVNGITDDMLVGKPLIEDLLDSFTEFCEDLPLVAHNAPFDAQFLKADIVKHEIPGPRGVILDTLPIARKVFPGLANYKLGTLVQHLNIPAGQFHRAEEDASYCGNLFIEIVKKIFNPGEAVVVDNLVALTGRPEYRFPVIEKTAKQLDLGLL